MSNTPKTSVNNALNVVIYDKDVKSTTLLTIPFSTDMQAFVKNGVIASLFSDIVLHNIQPEDNPMFLIDCISELSFQARVFINRGYFKSQTKIQCRDIPLLYGDGKMNCIFPAISDTDYEMPCIKNMAAYLQTFNRYQGGNGDLVKLKKSFVQNRFDDHVRNMEVSKSQVWFQKGFTNTFFKKEIECSIDGFDATKEAFNPDFINDVKAVLSIEETEQDIALYLNGECFYSEIDVLNETMTFTTYRKPFDFDHFAGGLSCVKPLI